MPKHVVNKLQECKFTGIYYHDAYEQPFICWFEGSIAGYEKNAAAARKRMARLHIEEKLR